MDPSTIQDPSTIHIIKSDITELKKNCNLNEAKLSEL